MKKTIIHIIDSLERGGAETLLVGVVNSLKGYNHVIIYFEPQNKFKNSLDETVVVHCLNASKPWEKLLKILFLRKLLSDYKPDIIHSHLFWPTIISRLVVGKNTKLISTYHNVFYGKRGANYSLGYKLLDKYSYNSRFITLCVSDQVKKDLEYNLGMTNNLHTFYNYVDDHFYINPKTSSYKSGETLRVVSIGNLKPQKNYISIIERFGSINSNNIVWEIHGEGPDRNSIERMLQINGIKNVKLKGVCSDVNEIIRDYHLFFMPSKWEGFGIALLEGMAAGLPCLISDLPVFKEVAEENALYFELANPDTCIDIFNKIIRGDIDLKNYQTKSLTHSLNYKKSDYLLRLSEFYS